MAKKAIVYSFIVMLLITSIAGAATDKDLKKVAELVKQRLEWAGFWYGETRIGLPYGVRLPLLIKNDGGNKYEVVVNHVLDIPGYEEEIVSYNVFILDNDRLIEQQSDKSHLKVPDELASYKDSGIIYEQSTTLDTAWRPIQGDDTSTVRVLNELLFDMDKIFTAQVDSFPSFKGQDSIRAKFNFFTAKDREVYMLVDGVDLVFVFKIHMSWIFPQMFHYFWDKKEIKFFNPNILDKIRENGKYYYINIGDKYPDPADTEPPIRLEIK
ncbi:MAG: hypothetical protein CO189_08010 [candidate division Zixibacteria bacterium CG_4_9_14_3_um_filter_46_8]|nr:MAG: hypothetical protein CO189_08010 [candidate division Zixibacteria bacterium CG_4_9_14_3_um_filter_46_8]